MPGFVLRIWLPDRPGVLGSVATCIGAVGGDVTGIDILERERGVAVDELVVELPDEDLLDSMVAEVGRVPGVKVESALPSPMPRSDPRLDALETAAFLVGHHDVAQLLSGLVERSRTGFDADWVVVMDVESRTYLEKSGQGPTPLWLAAFAAGHRLRNGGDGDGGPADLAWATMDMANLVVALGRLHRPFRARERLQLAMLVRIADVRWAELAVRPARFAHPSTGLRPATLLR
ncbi:MAG: ACT domain-containing protein [Acidimicrobiales bacterium]|nr:ACT domain-containing protein [Acidimicrobiales bacterium]MBO0893661.1 ACT domain-containing protein [Acidimicrobiales bacterium]